MLRAMRKMPKVEMARYQDWLNYQALRIAATSRSPRTQLNAVKEAYKMGGLYPATDVQSVNKPTQINILMVERERDTRAPLQGNGVVLHLGNGHGKNGHGTNGT